MIQVQTRAHTQVLMGIISMEEKKETSAYTWHVKRKF